MSTTISRIYNFVDDKNNGVPITSTRMDGELNQLVDSLNQKVIIKASAPSVPVAGQLWLDSTNKILKQYRNSEWVQMGVIHVATSAMATPQNGDFWLDSTNNILYARINGVWIQISNQPFAGFLSAWAAAVAPSGWLLCDGSAISRTTYSALFAVIGTTYGVGDNSTTFNIPNMKGKVVVGLDATQTEFDALAETGGEKKHVLTTAELAAHDHRVLSQTTTTVSDNCDGFKSGNPGVGFGSPQYSPSQATAFYSVDGQGNDLMENTGSGTGHNNLQPYIVVNWIIKY